MIRISKRKLVLIVFLVVLAVVFDNIAVRYGQEKRNELDEKYAQIIEEEVTEKTIKTISLKREMGNWGMSFQARLKLEDKKVSLLKGFIDGSTGANVTIAGSPIGFGISSPNFWLEIKDNNSKTSYEVYANFKRARLLVFNESVTYLVGRYTPTFTNN